MTQVNNPFANLTVAKIAGREKASLEEDFHGMSSQSHDNPFFFFCRPQMNSRRW